MLHELDSPFLFYHGASQFECFGSKSTQNWSNTVTNLIKNKFFFSYPSVNSSEKFSLRETSKQFLNILCPLWTIPTEDTKGQSRGNWLNSQTSMYFLCMSLLAYSGTLVLVPDFSPIPGVPHWGCFLSLKQGVDYSIFELNLTKFQYWLSFLTSVAF